MGTSKVWNALGEARLTFVEQANHDVCTRPPDLLAQVWGTHGPARLAAARDVWRNGILGFNLTPQAPPLFQLLTEIITFGLTWPALLSLSTFPTGRFTARWTWVACVPFFVVTCSPHSPSLVPRSGCAVVLTSLVPSWCRSTATCASMMPCSGSRPNGSSLLLSVGFLSLVIYAGTRRAGAGLERP